MNWLTLRVVLNTVWISWVPHNREWAGGSGLERVGRAGGLTIPSDTGDQVVFTAGQTNGHCNSDHTTRRADVKWNSLGPQATLLMHPSGPTGSVLVLHCLIGFEKAICKSRPYLWQLCQCVWTVLKCGYYNGPMILTSKNRPQ